MKISDLDKETRDVIILATIYCRNVSENDPYNSTFDKLKDALEQFHLKHEEEEYENLIRFLEEEYEEDLLSGDESLGSGSSNE